MMGGDKYDVNLCVRYTAPDVLNIWTKIWYNKENSAENTMSQCDIDLREGVDVRDTHIIVEALRAFKHDHISNPTQPHTGMDSLEHGRGKALVNALYTAVRTNYTEGMIVLFERERALHVRNISVPHLDNQRWRKSVHRHERGLKFLSELIDLFDNDTCGINAVLEDLLTSDNKNDPQRIQHVVECATSALSNKKIHAEVDDHITVQAAKKKI